ncbi:MAG: competence/damage-inducible protein A [Candidatus Limnocylindrales bacterium]
MTPLPPTRRILSADLLSIGSELTVGETRDTNAGELARSLTVGGVTVGRITALPDRLETVRDAIAAALERSDLVVSTGGLGPTPDDLTRESIAAVWGETPVVDPDLEQWLRDRWARLDQPFPEINLKQAWRIPSCEPMPNPNGSAPGWFVTRADGRVMVALPGPPREMRPMWADEALPRLRAIGLGADTAVRTFRLTGIGESQVAEILGERLLREPNPEVATYARVEAVDIRISAIGGADPSGVGRTAADLVDEVSALVEERLGDYIWAMGDTTWATAIGGRLDSLGWRVASAELGTGSQVGVLFGDVPWLTLLESRPARRGVGDEGDDLLDLARRVRDDGGAEVGLAVRTRERGGAMAVTVAVVTPVREHRETRTTFIAGGLGRSRAALVAAAILLETLRDSTEGPVS